MSKHTESEIERALKVLDLCDDHPSRAVPILQAMGLPIPLRTLQEWRNTHADKYERIRETRSDWVAGEEAEQAERTVQLAGQVEERLAQQLLKLDADKLERMSPDALALALMRVTKVKADNIEKSANLRGRPTKIIENRSLAEILQSTSRLLEKAGIQMKAPPRADRATGA